MEAQASKFRLAALLCVCVAAGPFLCGQTAFSSGEVPPNFDIDMKTAARLRPQLLAQSVAAMGEFSTGALVLSKLTKQARLAATRDFAWQLRIVEDNEFNAYASPDGTVYVESGLGRIAGKVPGLWAAILSHEIAHVLRRDWARRYLYQKTLENGRAMIALGDPGLPSGSWTDSTKASADLGRFCRQLEVEADRDGLMLMARSGYHPDFVPALHHLMHAAGAGKSTQSLYAMHPCWEERDRELSQAYLAASIEFNHRWPEWYSSPGGNPPVLVFAEQPAIRRAGSGAWELELPMHCQNLAGAVEVVVRATSGSAMASRTTQPEFEAHQVTGCTSPRTTVRFSLARNSDSKGAPSQWNEVYVLDAWGGVLARADLPNLH